MKKALPDIVKNLSLKIENLKYRMNTEHGRSAMSGWAAKGNKPVLANSGTVAGDYGVFKVHNMSKPQYILSGGILGSHRIKGDKVVSLYRKVKENI